MEGVRYEILDEDEDDCISSDNEKQTLCGELCSVIL